MTQQKQWSCEAWDAASHIYEAIKELPFIKEMADGTLSADRFRFYISQDNLYIDIYSRVLSHIASRLPLMSDTETFLGFALDGVAVEKSLHASYSPDISMGMSSTCLFYTSLLRAQANESVAVEAAAILPCFWIYQKVGEYLLSIAKLENNPYKDWISTYSDPSFDLSTKRAIDVCNRLAEAAGEETRQKMTQLFVECSRMEWMFWDSAYKMELWQNAIK